MRREKKRERVMALLADACAVHEAAGV